MKEILTALKLATNADGSTSTSTSSGSGSTTEDIESGTKTTATLSGLRRREEMRIKYFDVVSIPGLVVSDYWRVCSVWLTD